MSYKINYRKENDYIEITIEGDFELSILKDLAAYVTKLIEQHGFNRNLNDMRLAKLIKGVVDN